MKKYQFALLGTACLLSLGCANISQIASEPFKTVWGSSTRALEKVRPEASVKTFGCSWRECFDRVLALAEKKSFEVFISDPQKPLIVLMKIPGALDTTEVGVFFSEPETGKTKLEIASLSPTAKEIAADLLSKELKKTFTEL